MQPIMEVTCHIDGKNAKAAIYPEYITWTQKGWMGTGSKVALGAMTMGLSLAATGIKGKEDQATMPIRAISHITSERGKGLNTTVTIHSASGALALRMHHGEADQVRNLLNQLITGTYVPQQATPQPQTEPTTPPQTLSEKTDDVIQSAQKIMGAFNKFRNK